MLHALLATEAALVVDALLNHVFLHKPTGGGVIPRAVLALDAKFVGVLGDMNLAV